MTQQNELRAFRKRMNLTQAAAGKVFGVSARTWQNWELGYRKCPESVRVLMGLKESGKWTGEVPAAPDKTKN